MCGWPGRGEGAQPWQLPAPATPSPPHTLRLAGSWRRSHTPTLLLILCPPTLTHTHHTAPAPCCPRAACAVLSSQALAQCDAYLRRMQVVREAVDDTAGAAQV